MNNCLRKERNLTLRCFPGLEDALRFVHIVHLVIWTLLSSGFFDKGRTAPWCVVSHPSKWSIFIPRSTSSNLRLGNHSSKRWYVYTCSGCHTRAHLCLVAGISLLTYLTFNWDNGEKNVAILIRAHFDTSSALASWEQTRSRLSDEEKIRRFRHCQQSASL